MERSVVAGVVSPEAERGAAVARAAAWDPDARDAPRLRYRLEGGAAAGRAWTLHPRTGVLSLAGAPPATPPRSLNVSVSDGAHAAFARIKLSPAPANRSPPHFPHLVHEARALENQAPPLLLTTVKAYDEDAGEYGQVTYSIPSARLRDTFAVDARTGAFTTRVPLDREARAEWEVPVAAHDGGGLVRHTMVRVRVADVNDNSPEFPLREYRCAVSAARVPRAPFITLTAYDADAADNARLTYSVYEGEAHSDAVGLFHVDNVTGALSFARDATHFSEYRSAVIFFHLSIESINTIAAFICRQRHAWCRCGCARATAAGAPARRPCRCTCSALTSEPRAYARSRRTCSCAKTRRRARCSPTCASTHRPVCVSPPPAPLVRRYCIAHVHRSLQTKAARGHGCGWRRRAARGNFSR